MVVHHDKDRNIIYVTQQQYIEESFKQFNKYGISAFQTPMDDKAQYSKSQMTKPGTAEALQVATFKYRVLIAVNTLVKFTCNPGLVHWRASLRVLGYLYATRT